MTAPNMDAITASLERSLQNISLNSHHPENSSSSSNSTGETGEFRYAGDKSSVSDWTGNFDSSNHSSLELHSETPLPHFWEQCLDLKTGEIYFINWKTGMRSQEDPRTNPEILEDCFSEYDSCSYDSEGSSPESSPTVASKEEWRQYNNISISRENNDKNGGYGEVLVVAGCKSCLMYYMVPKQEEECPKCCGQLLHFDRS